MLFDRDFDSLFTGAVITSIVCIISSLLYYLFKHAAFNSSSTLSTDLASNKRRTKKQEQKRTKKTKKRQTVESGALGDPEPGQTEVADEDDDAVILSVQNDTPVSSGSDRSTPDSKKSDAEDAVNVENSEKDDFGFERVTHIPEPHHDFVVLSEAGLKQVPSDDSDSTPSSPKADCVSTTITQAKSKRTRRRVAKSVSKAADNDGQQQTEQPTMKTANVSAKAALDQLDKSNVTIRRLQEQLEESNRKLEENSKRASILVQENDQLRTSNEQLSLGVQVLQEQYTELLRSNKSVEASLKTVQNENERLISRLDQVNSEATHAKTELRTVKDQLTEANAKLNSMAAAAARGPSPDLVRSQELAQLTTLSNENCLLKARLDQFDKEVNQLHQTNMRQQQELQAFRLENRNLRTEHESALEEIRVQRQNEQADASSRLASYEAQLQHRCHELELEKQMNQDYLRQLNEARTELQHLFDREKRQAEVISSLEYQFAELNAHKQRLVDEKAASTLCSSELQTQLATRTNELEKVRMELEAAQAQVALLTQQLKDQVQTTADDTMLQELEQKLEVAQTQRTVALSDVERYKTALVETEAVLSRLQASVEQTELSWRQRYVQSEAERTKSDDQLVEARKTVQQLSTRLEETERRMSAAAAAVHASPGRPITSCAVSSPVCVEQSGEDVPPVCSFSSSTQTPCYENAPTDLDVETCETPPEEAKISEPDAVDLAQPVVMRDSDTDCDFDAVLVDDTDLHVPDNIWDSENLADQTISTQHATTDQLTES